MKEKLLVGDCLETLKKIPDNSIDSVVTDPPYELGFMGKSWDSTGIAFNVAVWKECMRVLKPGGHLLAFSGSRTYHRMAVAIEDAGFEIRDQIMWIYGSGFPKSMAIDKAIDKRGGKNIGWFGGWLKNWREENNISQKQIAALFPSKSGNLTGCVANWELGLNLPTAEQFTIICQHFKLPFDSVEEAERKVIGTKFSGIANKNEKGRHTIGSSKATEVNITIPSTPEAKQWQGWGTALKPAHEPIVVARKPISEKTVAENVLTYGTGAINIDASRVGTTGARTNSTKGAGSNGIYSEYGSMETDIKDYGRFPANLILSHNPDCQLIGTQTDDITLNGTGNDKLFHGNFNGGQDQSPKQATTEVYQCTEGCPFLEFPNSKSTGGRIGKKDMGSVTNVPAGEYEAGDPGYGDNGTAARFFYCAKTSKAERNAGLTDLPTKQTVGGGGLTAPLREDGSLETASAGGKYGSIKAVKQNFHPTVKPLTLIRYLIKLVTPPNGTVLDPFLGSGTTAVAATLDNYKWIGCELTEEYLPIINGRVAYAEAEVKKAKKKKETMPTLFEEEQDVL